MTKPKKRKEFRELEVQHRGAEVAPRSYSDEDNTIEVLWTEGARILRRRWFGEAYEEELSLDDGAVDLSRMNNGAPFLALHNAWSGTDTIGSVVPGSARFEDVDGKRVGLATIKLTAAEDAQPLIQRIREGTLNAVSVGYSVQKYEVTENESAPDLYRAVSWTPLEVSIVPIGADPGACTRSAEHINRCELVRTTATEEDKVMPNPTKKTKTERDQDTATEVVTREADAPVAEVKPMGGDATPATPEPVVETRAAPAAAPQPAANIDPDQIRADTLKQERERVEGIETAARAFPEIPAGFVDNLKRSGVSLDQARAQLIEEKARLGDQVQLHPQVTTPIGGQDADQTRHDAIVNSLMHRYQPGRIELSEAGRQFRGMRLLDVARECLGAEGIPTRGLGPNQVAELALERRGGMHSTSDFPAILANVAGKSLRMAYQAFPKTFQQFCRRVEATDFKEMSRVQLGEVPALEKVNESGEFKRGEVKESKEAYKVETYGKVVSITRQVLVNDDLDAFTRIPGQIGVAVAELESNVVWGIITTNGAMGDGTALFHASHKNLAGSGAAIDVTSIGAGRSAMMKQKGLDGKTRIRPIARFLLVPAALETVALQLVAQNLVPRNQGDVVPDTVRSLTVLAEPLLDDASATAWYLSADPSQIDTIEYAYLAGEDGAMIETRAGFDVDGMEIKIRHDFGAKAIDHRGLYKNPGA